MNIDIRAIRREYLRNDILSDDNRMLSIKNVLHELGEADMVIFLAYTELQSYRKLGRLLGVSHTTAATEVKRIRQLIKEKLNKHND